MPPATANPEAVPSIFVGHRGARKLPAVAFASFVSMALLMATRRLYIAPDDEAYLNYFRGVHVTSSSSLWLQLLAEPLWNSYASTAGELLGVEAAMRVTLGLSTFTFLYCSSLLSNGASFVVLSGFVLDFALGTQMYFNQIRQGVALSVFLAVAQLVRRHPRTAICVGACAAALVHSSFIVVMFCAVPALFVRRRSVAIGVAVIAASAVMLASRETIKILDSIEFGRRAKYALESSVNMNFYLMAIPQYFGTLLIAQPDPADTVARRWHGLAVALVAATFGMSVAHEAGPRLFYVCNALILIIIAQNIRQPRFLAAAAIWLTLGMFAVLNESRKLDFNEDSWVGRWALILRAN